MPTSDHHIKLNDGTNTRKFKLLQRDGRRQWSVRELPPQPNVDSPAAAREGLPPDRLLPYDNQDWSWGQGLTRPTPQIQRPGHVLRYANGFNIDTSEVGRVKHGPEVTDVGTLLAAPIDALSFIDEVWFLTPTHLYSWDGTTLKLEFTNPDGAFFTSMEVLGSNLFMAASNSKYWHTTGIGGTITVTEKAFAVDNFVQLGNQLWRSFSTDQISASTDPADATPTWSAGASAGDTGAIKNLFSISGLLGVATTSSLYIVTVDADDNITSTELNKVLRVRRGGDAFSIKAESGTDVWFSDGFKSIIRLTAEGFEIFDIRPSGPFRGTDERPVTEPDVDDIGIDGIAQDVDAIYVAAGVVADSFIFKGVEIARGVFAWSPIHKLSGVAAVDILAVLGLSGDLFPVVYFNDGTTVKKFDTVWSEYAASWELETMKFNATLPQWEKMWNRIRAFLERSNVAAKIVVSHREDDDTSYLTFGGTGEMTANGNNEIEVTTPIDGREIQLKFAGSTTLNTENVDMLSFLLEGFLRTDNRPIFDFTVIADDKADGTFLKGLRDLTTSFVTLTDRFGDTHTVAVLPGFPEEAEIIDEAQRAPVMSYHIIAQTVT